MDSKKAARPGRQGGNIDRVQADVCPKALDKSIQDRNLYDEDVALAAFSDAWERRWQPWLDRVELRVSRGCAGSSERAVARAIVALVPPDAALFVPIPALAAQAGVGRAATRAALRRLVEKRLLRFEAGNGRGILSVIQISGAP